MNTTVFLDHVAAYEQEGDANMQPDRSERRVLGEHEEVEIHIQVGRLNEGFNWSLFNLHQLVRTGHAETRSDARKDAAAFAKAWVNDEVPA